MDDVNVLNQMKQYDFNTKINVTMIFEISDDDNDISMEKINNEQRIEEDMIKSSEDITAIKNKAARKKHDKNRRREKRANRHKKCNSMSTNNSEKSCHSDKSLKNIHNKCHSEVKSNVGDKSMNPLNKQNVATEEVQPIHSTQSCNLQLAYENDTLYIKDALTTLSEHIIIIMQAYYNYRKIKNSKNDPLLLMETESAFRRVKYHFFHLSYSTVVTIILPKEHNKQFVTCFLQKTVEMANAKLLKWKCKCRDVKPFYDELINWGRLKRNNINALSIQRRQNSVLKQLLNTNTNLPQTKDLADKHIDLTNTQTTNCLSLSEAAQTNVNLNPDTCNNTIAKQVPVIQHHSGPAKNLQNNNYFPSNPPDHSFQGQYDNFANTRRPGPYTVRNRPSQPPPPYKYTENRQFQNHWAVLQPSSCPQPQIMQVNIGAHLHIEDTNNNTYLCEQQSNEQTNFSPVITNVKSLNPYVFPKIGKCYVCGKTTDLICAKYNQYFYCSYLCQELDFGISKSTYNS